MSKRIFAVALTLCSFSLLSSNADAAFAIRLTSGASQVTVFDNGAGDTDATVGAIDFNGIVGTFAIALQTASRSYSAGLLTAQLINDVQSISTTAAGSITFETSATNYSGPSGVLTGASSTDGLMPVGAYVWQSFFNDGNGLFATQTAIGAPYVNPVVAFSNDVNNVPLAGTPFFSLTNIATITLGGPIDNLNFSGRTAVTGTEGEIPGIPEPASMILFGMGGIGLLGGAVRRRRAEKAAA